MCFELTVSLMRSLEMIVAIAPDIFEDQRRQNSDLILARICQVILFDFVQLLNIETHYFIARQPSAL